MNIKIVKKILNLLNEYKVDVQEKMELWVEKIDNISFDHAKNIEEILIACVQKIHIIENNLDITVDKSVIIDKKERYTYIINNLTEKHENLTTKIKILKNQIKMHQSTLIRSMSSTSHTLCFKKCGEDNCGDLLKYIQMIKTLNTVKNEKLAYYENIEKFKTKLDKMF